MTTLELFDPLRGTSEIVCLGSRIAQGGAGAVHLLERDASRVVKLYHPGVLTRESDHYRRRIEAMLRLPPSLPPIRHGTQCYVQVAWPLALAREARSGRFLGFAMPVIDLFRTAALEYMLNARQATARQLRTSMAVRVTLCRQLAGVVAALHAEGHYIVDLKPINASFYTDTLYMAVLDCDGFSIADGAGRFPAPQYTPEYLAPEFHAPGADPNDDPEAQDRFALAVVVFQLLNHGIHPYSGKAANASVPTELWARVAADTYAYGGEPHPAVSPNLASTHDCLPAELRALFDRAFGSDRSARPSAREWRDVLERYADSRSGALVECENVTEHYRFPGLSCPVCRRQALIDEASASKVASAPKGRAANTAQKARRRSSANRSVSISVPTPGVSLGRLASSSRVSASLPISISVQNAATGGQAAKSRPKPWGKIVIAVLAATVVAAWLVSRGSYGLLFKVAAGTVIPLWLLLCVVEEDARTLKGAWHAMLFVLAIWGGFAGLKYGWHRVVGAAVDVARVAQPGARLVQPAAQPVEAPAAFPPAADIARRLATGLGCLMALDLSCALEQVVAPRAEEPQDGEVERVAQKRQAAH